MPITTFADIAREIRDTTQYGLTDMARQRIEVISFFLLGLLVCTFVIQKVRNGLRRDFPILPRLSFGRSLGIIMLWGLLFVLVLTMISGARELMTSGAWGKQGVTYKLAPPTPPSVNPIDNEIRIRVGAIHKLGAALMDVAKAHENTFPQDPTKAVDEALWHLPKPKTGRYV